MLKTFKSRKMKKPIITTIWILSFLLINSCSTTRQITTDKKLKFALQAGTNIGGITENTDLTVVPNVVVPPEAKVDAFTGATRTGFNMGIHLNQAVWRNQVETGIDYMHNYQIFNYIDAGNFYIGVRRLQVSQVMIPLTYNFVLFKNLLPKTDIHLKAGLLSQINLISTFELGILPQYSYNHLSNGLTIGLSAFPFQFDNENKLGFYFDCYRGSQIYKDFYNQSYFEMPGSSFIKFGLKYQFN